MDQNENKGTHHKQRKAKIILICGMTFAALWLWIFPQSYSPLWKKFTFLPESIYFSVKEIPFVLMEDAERCHTGDLRHQIWSDGKIKVFFKSSLH